MVITTFPHQFTWYVYEDTHPQATGTSHNQLHSHTYRMFLRLSVTCSLLSIKTCYRTLCSTLVHVNDHILLKFKKGVVYKVSCLDCPSAETFGDNNLWLAQQLNLSINTPSQTSVCKHTTLKGDLGAYSFRTN